VLVKLRKDEFVDRLIEESGGKVLYLAEAPIGYYLYRGIQESNGDVLVFLDDDDAFAARKLSYIYDLFSQKSNLGYYHHHLAYIINSQNKIVGRFFGGPREVILMDPRDVQNVRRVLSRYGIIGSLMSTTVVRRDVIEPFLDELKSLVTGQDSFMFLAALSSRYLILHEPLELSYYRVTVTNCHFQEALSPLILYVGSPILP
jgi:glycosyltransferase involved in cell wall biosynthesis